MVAGPYEGVLRQIKPGHEVSTYPCSAKLSALAWCQDCW